MDIQHVDGAHGDVGPAAETGGGQRGVHGPGGQDRRDREPIDRPLGIGHDQDVCPTPGPCATASRASRSSASRAPTRGGDGCGTGRSRRDWRQAPTSHRGSERSHRARERSQQVRRDRRRSGAGGVPSDCSRHAAEQRGRRPSSTRRSITIRSRSGSIAGFVTWANAWRRWSATGRSRRARPGVGVSSPMLQSGSWPSSAIVLMSSRARSASRPARWRITWSVDARPSGRRPARDPRGPVGRHRGWPGRAGPNAWRRCPP